MTNFSSVTLLRFVCCWEVVFLHWFARIEMRDYSWIWSGAVPCFLLISAFIYGLRYNGNGGKMKGGLPFIIKRWKSLSIVYYPFIFAVFVWCIINDGANIQDYVLSLICDFLYVTMLTKPLPGCGHLWFLQTLGLCYLLLAFLCNSNKIYTFFSNKKIILALVILTFLLGGVKRDNTFVYLLFYGLTFVYANKIFECSKTIGISSFIIVLVLLYLLLSYPYEDIFWYGIYLKYFHTCIIAVWTILLFVRVAEGKQFPHWICWLSSLSMEVYLIHHLFIFKYPLYISLPLTIILSIVLHGIGIKLKKAFHL